MSSLRAQSFKEDLEDFFGVSFLSISSLSKIIYRDYERPDWLRRCPTIDRYPRFCLTHTVTDHTVPFNQLGSFRIHALAEQTLFVVESLHGKWQFGKDGFTFENLIDAAHFRMRF